MYNNVVSMAEEKAPVSEENVIHVRSITSRGYGWLYDRTANGTHGSRKVGTRDGVHIHSRIPNCRQHQFGLMSNK